MRAPARSLRQCTRCVSHTVAQAAASQYFVHCFVSHRLFQPDVLVGADITYDPVLVSAKRGISHLTTHSETIAALRQIKDLCSAMVVMMKAVGRTIDVLITATVRTQVCPALQCHAPAPCMLTRPSLCSRGCWSALQRWVSTCCSWTFRQGRDCSMWMTAW